MPFSGMTAQIADLYALTSGPGPEQVFVARTDCAIRPGWLWGIDLGRIAEFRILRQRERPTGV
jgi:hypothetical protein